MKADNVYTLAKKGLFLGVVLTAQLFIFIGAALLGGIGIAFLTTGVCILVGGLFGAMMWRVMFDDDLGESKWRYHD